MHSSKTSVDTAVRVSPSGGKYRLYVHM